MNTRKIFAVWAAFVLSVLTVQAQGEGPGGVGTGLRLWLRADDPATLTLNRETVSNYTASPQTTIAWINVLPSGQNPSTTQTVVDEWRSSVGTTRYRHLTTPTLTATQVSQRRKPVFIERHYLMNYHPAVDFYQHWLNGNSYTSTVFSSFLTSTNAAMNAAKPTNSSTFAVLNGAVKEGFSGDNQNSYFIFWHNNERPPTGYGQIQPGLGFRNNAGSGQPRLRIGGGASNRINISSFGFDPGATTIAEYKLRNVPSGNSAIARGNVEVGYNMYYVSNNSGTGSGYENGNTSAWYMSTNSSLGGSLYHSSSASRSFKGMMSEVVQYERTLDDDELNAINSYFAIKYGITLRPSSGGHIVPRFDYKMSDGDDLWPGATGGGKWITFYNNIAAVIRDDDSKWNNIQTHSTDVGSIVHLGIPATLQSQLHFDGTIDGLGVMENDTEAVVVGNDTGAGVTTVHRESCGSFDHIFQRKWLVNKLTENGRSITLLVGAQNNLANALGTGSSTGLQNMYSALVAGNEVFLIVADSPEKLDPMNQAAFGDFKAVVPMQYRNGEHQCTYTFTEDETYFTFGYKPVTGCAGEVGFSGIKTLEWNQWTSASAGSTFYNNTNSATTQTHTNSLGDGISAKTTVTYSAGVRASRYYPRVTTSPRGALDLVRHSSGTTGVVTATIDFTKSNNTATPLIPEFFISGLDARDRQYDKVTVTGYCGSNVVLPQMTYASSPAIASYAISGTNVATVDRNRSETATGASGRVNVAFSGGVDKVVVEYTLAGRGTSTAQHIYISPLNIRPVPPPPVINEDGLAFLKDVYKEEITTCEEVQYDFYITNVNIESKYVKFIDVLPAGLKWSTLTLDSINSNAAHNPRGENIGNTHIHINSSIGTATLDIDSLLIPCVSTVKVTATAKLDDNAVPVNEQKMFNNRAAIDYDITVNNNTKHQTLPSQDRFTLADSTSFWATWVQKQDSVFITTSTSYASYLPNREIEVTFKVRNTGAAITDMYLSLDWNAGFSFVPGSYNGLGQVVTDNSADLMLDIANSATGDSGFTLPANATTEFKFKLRAPAPANLEYDFNEHGVEQAKYATLRINYEFISEQDGPCVIQSLQNNLGEIRVPYSGRTHLMTNKHVTTKLKK